MRSRRAPCRNGLPRPRVGKGLRPLGSPSAPGGRHDVVRLHALGRGVPTRGPRRVRRAGRGHGVRLRLDVGPFPSVDEHPGTQPVRVVRPRRGVAGDRPHRRGDRRHLSDRACAPGGARAGDGNAVAAARRAVLLGRRNRRGTQRAHPRATLAAARDPARDARGSGRRHPQVVDRRHRRPPRPLLHGGERGGSSTRRGIPFP